MSGDIKLSWSNDSLEADVSIEENDLATHDGLETAVIISLFSDRRLEDADILPPGETSRRGWWADQFEEVEADKIGSKLWLLNRAKSTNDIVSNAQQYCVEALQWLIDDKIAESVDVTVELVDSRNLFIKIEIKQPDVDPTKFRYAYNWQAQAARAS